MGLKTLERPADPHIVLVKRAAVFLSTKYQLDQFSGGSSSIQQVGNDLGLESRSNVKSLQVSKVLQYLLSQVSRNVYPISVRCPGSTSRNGRGYPFHHYPSLNLDQLKDAEIHESVKRIQDQIVCGDLAGLVLTDL